MSEAAHSVIPGRATGARPEPMTTTMPEEAVRETSVLAKAVFMGSGLGPSVRPGMTARNLR